MLLRPVTDADVPELLALCRAADTAVWGDSDWTEADLREELEGDATVVELDGRIAALATFELRGERALGDGYVHPELQRRGIGSRVLDLYEEKAAGAATLDTAILRDDAGADCLLRGRGYAPARHFYRMLVEHDAVPEPPVWPAGAEVAPFDRADARDLHAALEEAFAQEWSHTGRPFEEFEAQRLGNERFDPSLTWVVKDGGEIAALSLNDWKRNGDWGWIGSLAVRPGWRRRGLGEALLRQSFREFWRRGERRVALGVDVQNPTGATRLYERVGMRQLWEAVVYRKELS